MFKMKALTTILNIAVIVIGIFMIVKYAASALPPLLSGIAFVLLGIAHLLEK